MDARDEYLWALRSQLGRVHWELLDRLLRLFHRGYTRRKRQAGMLDYEDLETLTRDLLAGDEGLRRHIAGRYRLVLVDEFQDINPLQCEIIRLLDQDNLLLVGDENQSIYGFRDAEVELFRREGERAEREGRFLTLGDNFRSQRQILSFVDFLFDRDQMLRPGYLRLEPCAPAEPDPGEPRVEIVLVDKKCGGDGELDADHARVAEARLVAARLQALKDEDGYDFGEMAILFRSRKAIAVFQRELEAAGIDCYLAAGRGYFERLELGDVINLMKLLVNPLDDKALAAVLRSPYAGAGDDVLFWLGRAAKEGEGYRRPFWELVREGDGLEKLGGDERRRLERFVDEFTRLRSLARRGDLSRLAEAACDFNDYRAALATGGRGRRGLANLEKFVALAAEFAETRGGHLESFVSFLEHQQGARVQEVDAPVEEEGVEAVTLLTIHAAKGLEFPVVVLPQLGADMPRDDKPLVLLDRAPGGGCGLYYRHVGTRIADEVDGPAFDYARLEEEEKEREAAEEKRLYYVAMTRARSRLLLVGTGDAGGSPKEEGEGKPLDWIRHCFALSRGSRRELDDVDRLDDIEGMEVGFRLVTDARSLVAERPPRPEATAPGTAPTMAEDLRRLPPPAAYVPSTIAATAVKLYQDCPRRYYLEAVLRVREPAAAGAGGAGGGLSPLDLGTLVHAVLEHSPLPLPREDPLAAVDLQALAAGSLGEAVTLGEEEQQSIGRLAANLDRAPVAASLYAAAAAGELRREVPFSFLSGETIVGGRIDVMVTGGERVLVVDYKTGAVSEEKEVGSLGAGYRGQMDTYALAAAAAFPGREVEVVLVFLDAPGREYRLSYDERGLAAARERLEAVLADMRSGDFPPRADAAGGCRGCPGRGRLPLCPSAPA